ncbi:hypothetical protein [Actinomadura madurae]|nr:hypothetical protein [Actinomadura madurae]
MAEGSAGSEITTIADSMQASTMMFPTSTYRMVSSPTYRPSRA